MADVYAICQNGCKYPTYTREQVLALLQQVIEDQSLLNVDADYAAIKKIIDVNGGEDVKFWTGTEADFNALNPAPTVSRFVPRRGLDGTIYICIDDTGLSNLPTQPITSERLREICI